MADEVIPPTIKGNLALSSIGRGNAAITDIPIENYFLIFVPAVVILILCTVLFEKDETVTKNNIIWLQAIDVIMVFVLIYGLLSLFAALGQYTLTITKS